MEGAHCIICCGLSFAVAWAYVLLWVQGLPEQSDERKWVHGCKATVHLGCDCVAIDILQQRVWYIVIFGNSGGMEWKKKWRASGYMGAKIFKNGSSNPTVTGKEVS